VKEKANEAFLDKASNIVPFSSSMGPFTPILHSYQLTFKLGSRLFMDL